MTRLRVIVARVKLAASVMKGAFGDNDAALQTYILGNLMTAYSREVDCRKVLQVEIDRLNREIDRLKDAPQGEKKDGYR